jgi:1-deoxy-D-xylulose-5-phosphate reductoisomerase
VVRRRVSLFGATGSVGKSAVDLLSLHQDRFEVVTVAANNKAGELAGIARKLNAECAIVCDEAFYGNLQKNLSGTNIECAAGERALIDAASEKVDLIIMAISGAAGLRATFAAAGSGADLALANKESVVCAGALLMKMIEASGARLLPIDSEHNAVFQILQGRDKGSLKKITLTASGGPFRDWPLEKIANAKPEDALNHPVWNMGAKISVDCASLMNKGLELIEAQHIFSLKPERLDVLIHPQSIVHALVAYADGSVLAQMAMPDMRVAISACLDWPNRMASGAPGLDLAAVKSLSFENPDEKRFPCLKLARAAMKAEGAAPCTLSAANEIAVEAFLQNRIGFQAIPQLIELTMEKMTAVAAPINFASLEDVLSVDLESRRLAATFLPYHDINLRRASA